MALPDFLIAGVPKAGTSALHAALAPHPGLYLSAVKEPKFFLTDGPPPRRGGPGDVQTYQEHVWRRADYEALFDPAPPGALRGEATPFYLHDLDAHARIAKLLPEVKIILVLRDPVDRAHSNWAHLYGAGLESESDFLRAVELEPRRTAAGWAAFWQYTGLGQYGTQVKSLLEHVERERVLLLRYRDLRDAPAATLDRVCAFLGVATGLLAEAPPENVRRFVADTPANAVIRLALRTGGRIGHHFPVPVRVAARTPLLNLLHRRHGSRPRVPPAQRAALLPRFTDEIRRLEDVSGESYADWLSLEHASRYTPKGATS
ncbi:sulfotransferase family protein [Dactylosporangium sp. CS-033363]|uniref:sulfotransferase family protein n=1 Tax=Dactylosporangium sp. CS-033363 TaxID=3239935 RepID=UPI003D89F85E